MSELSAQRRMWALFEPIHAVTYFAPQARAAFETAGLRGFWRGYFAGRSAPLGPIGPAPVVASFFGFNPPMVGRALPDVWTRITPEDALAARLSGATEALTAVWSDVDAASIAGAAELLRAAATGIEVQGRVLGAANAALPWPPDTEPVQVLWHAATILREQRGDGHVAALLTAGLDGCETVVWRSALADAENGGANPARAFFQPARGWTDDDWAAATERLAARGWLHADGTPTAEAHRAFAAAEVVTDRLARGPWDRLGADATERLARLLAPLTARASTYLPHPNPIGLPPPLTV